MLTNCLKIAVPAREKASHKIGVLFNKLYKLVLQAILCDLIFLLNIDGLSN